MHVEAEIPVVKVLEIFCLKNGCELNAQEQFLDCVDFLLSEVMVGRMISWKEKCKSVEASVETVAEVRSFATHESRLREIGSVLGIANVDPLSLNDFSALLSSKIKTLVMEKGFIMKSFLFSRNDYSTEQIQTIQNVNDVFSSDYSLRLRMICQRLLVTINSMKYSSKCDNINLSKLMQKVSDFTASSSLIVDIFHIFTLNSLSPRLFAQLQPSLPGISKLFRIGDVPDRGGRTAISDMKPISSVKRARKDKKYYKNKK